LILDEPTSAVDAEAEAAIVDAIGRLMRGRTVILITHRSSLLRSCTALLTLEGGRVVSDTTHVAPLAVPSDGRDSERAPLMRHPAVQAWRRLDPRSRPDRITPLRVRTRKATVYRLEGAGAAGAGVIAKRSRKIDSDVERTVYEDILPRLDITSPRCYGFVDDPGGEWRWTFLEEATGEKYSRLLAADREAASRWLARLHTSAESLGTKAALPDAGPNRYLGFLKAAREALPRHLGNPALAPEEVVFLEGVVANLTDLEARWSGIEDICAVAPTTLVHGDFNAKNIRSSRAAGRTTIVVFDWEDAGWAVPAVDLAQQTLAASNLSADPDLEAYRSIVRERWPHISGEAWSRLAYCGSVFRSLAALYWGIRGLKTEWASLWVENLRLYEGERANALTRLGLNGEAHVARDERHERPVSGAILS
jgi:hypothetical protein